MLKPPSWEPSNNYIYARQTVKFLWFEGISDRLETIKSYRKKKSKEPTLDSFLDPLLSKAAGFLGASSFSTRSVADGRLIKASKTMTSEDIATRAAVLEQVITFLNPEITPWSRSESLSALYRRFSQLPKSSQQPTPETIEEINKTIETLRSSRISRYDTGNISAGVTSCLDAFYRNTINYRKIYPNIYDEFSDYGVRTKQYTVLQNDIFDFIDSKKSDTENREPILASYLATKLLCARVIDKYEGIFFKLADAHISMNFKMAFINKSDSKSSSEIMAELKPTLYKLGEQINEDIDVATNSLTVVIHRIYELSKKEKVEPLMFLLPRIAFDIQLLQAFRVGTNTDGTIDRLCHGCPVPLHVRHGVLEASFEQTLREVKNDVSASSAFIDAANSFSKQSVNHRITSFWLE